MHIIRMVKELLTRP